MSASEKAKELKAHEAIDRMPIGKIIDLDDDTRRLYSKYDFKFFLDRHIREQKYSDKDMQMLHSTYATVKSNLKGAFKKNRRQSLYVLDGMIRKAHSGGFLPSFFNLDESRGGGGFINFEEVGRTWAYFEVWSRAERRKIFRRTFWDIAVKTGALLGVVLAIIKILEVLRS